MEGSRAPPPTADTAVVFRKGAWSNEEDEKLRRAVDKYGLRNWVAVEKHSGLGRPAKNCRLRWLNYLRPNLKKYPFTEEEEELIFRLHSEYGNSWSRIASKLPGRSDNDIKNFWHKRSNKRNRRKLNDNEAFVSTQTSPLPNTPTSSRTQNLLISPNHRTLDTQPNYLTQQFSFRKPPILSSAPQARFSNSTFPPQMQLESPNSAPLSPLQLRLSTPVPSQFCFGSSPSMPDLTALLSPSMPQDSYGVKMEPPSIQVESDSKFEIMEELRDAQAKVRFLKKKLKLRRISNKTSSETTDLTGSSSGSITKECGSHNYAHSGSTELGKDYSLGEIFKREDSMTFHEQIDFSDLNIPNTMINPNDKTCHFQGPVGLYSEGSTLLQDSFAQGDNNNNNNDSNRFDQRSNEPLRDAFTNSQSTATTPGDDICWSSYLQSDQDCYLGCGFGQEMSDCFLDSSCFVSAPIMEKEYFRVEEFSFHPTTPGVGGNPNETNMLMHKSSSAPNLIENTVDFRYLADVEQECPTQGVPYSIQSCGGCDFEFDGREVKRECTSGEAWRREPCREQSLMESLMVDDNLWLDSVDLMEPNNWNDGSGCGNTWKY